ncbi:MAG: GNAT family N-acetyltransferase [Deltaproteobacteria bacterium]|nr:GNAT family N-acetyltransferase [Deltaproteobacteria bacterium]
MARLLHSGVEDARPCPYLPGVRASLEHRVLLDVTPGEADELLDRGWRHFGPGWFRPACGTCTACLSTRIIASEFVPSRSQRRARRRASRLRVEIGEPGVDRERLALFHAWQRDRVQSRGWEWAPFAVKDYWMRFAFATPFSREVAYYDDDAGGRLVMVSICDETPRAWSAAFCFYDPAHARMSPGIANILELIAIARRNGQRHVYLGYCVLDCQSLRYKAAFRPHETLVGFPLDDETPRWLREAEWAESEKTAGRQLELW